jgi:ISXO2-like transposase domain
MEHRIVNHAREYVSADGTHINSLEGFRALVKRGIVGQYHHVTVRYLPRYLDEFSYRFAKQQSASAPRGQRIQATIAPQCGSQKS